MTLQELRDTYLREHGRALPDSELKYLGGINGDWNNMSVADFTNNVIKPSPEYKQRQEKLANAARTSKVNAVFDPLIQANDQLIATKKVEIGSEFTDVAKKLKETAGQSESNLTESMNRYGLLESGRNAAGIGKIQENLSADIGKADIQRAITEANLALESASYNSEVGTAKLAATKSLDPLGMEATAAELSKRGFDMTKYKTVFDAYDTGVLNSWTEPDDTLINLIKQMTGV